MIQERKLYTLVYTPGTPASAQPIPHITSPITSKRPLFKHTSGEPPSPFKEKKRFVMILLKLINV